MKMEKVFIEHRPSNIEARWWSIDEQRYYRKTFVFLWEAKQWAMRNFGDDVKIVIHD
jgi:hypothetical protein